MKKQLLASFGALLVSITMAYGQNCTNDVTAPTPGDATGANASVNTTYTQANPLEIVLGSSGTAGFGVGQGQFDPNTNTGAQLFLPAANSSTQSLEIFTTATDDCPTANFPSISASKSSFSCSDVGSPIQITIYYADGSANFYQESMYVNVTETTAPTITAADQTVVLDGAGSGSLDVSGISASDNCDPNPTLSYSQSTFDCTDLGQVTVTITAVDASNNQSTQDITVTVVDQTAPVITAADQTVVLDGTTGLGSLDVTGISAADNCTGTPTITYSQSSFDCDDLGQITVTITATDGAAQPNSSTQDITVTVVDQTAPVITAPATQTVTLDANGAGTLDVTGVSAADVCDNTPTLTYTQSTFDCDDVGTVTVTVTATDASNNSSTEDITVTVEDNTAPVITAADQTVVLDGTGSGSLDVSGISAADACTASPVLSYSQSTFDCTDLGQVTVTITAVDDENNQSTQDITVTVVDQTAPVITAADQTVVLDGTTGLGSLDVTGISAADNCTGTPTITYSQSSFDCDDLGQITVTITATDGAAQPNSSTQDITVTVVDQTAPVITAPATQTVTLDANGAGTLDVTGVSAADVCDNTPTLTYTQSTFDCDDVGTVTVTVTATDASNNSSTEDITVTVEDNTAPVITAADQTVVLDGTGSGSLDVSGISAADACTASPVLSYSQSTFDCTDLGQVTVTITAVDDENNQSTQDITVTVVDQTAPVITAADQTVVLDGTTGLGSLDVTGISAADNCTGTPTITYSQSSFDCDDLGQITVTITATDGAAQPNSSTQDITVTVVDQTAPVITAPATQTVTLDANGAGTLDVTGVSAADVCDNTPTLTYTQSTFDCDDVGTVTVTVTATDASNNSSTEDITVTVEDNTAPVITAADQTVVLDGTGSGSLDVSGISAADACTASPVLSYSQSTFDCTDLGQVTVTITAVDDENNQSTQDITVTVVDQTAPVITAADQTVVLDATTGLGVLSGISAADNCTGTPTITYSQSSFDCDDLGQITVTVTATDASNNQSTQDITVTVVDQTTPTVVGATVDLYLDANGSGSISNIQDLFATATDNTSCDLTYQASRTTFDCDDIDFNSAISNPSQSDANNTANWGTTPVTITLTDAAGLSSSAVANVRVIDNIKPSITAPSLNLTLNSQGYVDISSTMTTTLASVTGDNCSLDASRGVINQTYYDCDDLGSNSVTAFVFDSYGNSQVATVTVEVSDVTPPSITAADQTVTLDANGAGTLDVTGISASDVCDGNPTLTYTQSTFDCDDVGTVTVTVTATDASNNSSTEDITVTVEDNTAPVITAADQTVVLDGTGSGSLDVSGISAADACTASPVLSYSQSTFDCTDLGQVTVTITAVDDENNQSTQDITVTVVDQTAPVITAADQTVVLDGTTGLGSLDVTGISAADNCTGTPTITYSQSSFDCDDLGQITVTITATDGAAQPNSSTQDITVTVVDQTAPVITAPATQTVTLDANGAGTLDVTGVSAADVCDNTPTLTYTQSTFDCDDVGTVTVTVTATDASNNSSTEDITVTVEDNTAPVITAADQTVVLDGTGSGSLDVSGISAADACTASPVLSYSQSTFDCTDLGQVTVTITAVDDENNQSTQDITVTVVDQTAPVITAADQTVVLDGTTGLGSLDVTGISAADNCTGTPTITYSQSSFDCDDLGQITVTITATDGAAQPNSSTQDITVTVVDQTAPVITAPATQTVTLDANGAGTLDVTGVSAADVCDNTPTLTYTQSTFDCDDVGTVHGNGNCDGCF